MKEVAVIIPAYKAHDTIKQTLMSIAMQKAIDFKCYLVIDGEEKGTYDYLYDFPDLDLKILYMENNGGPGVARQYGIDNSDEPFLSFIDADDTYLSSLALYYQHIPFKRITIEKNTQINGDNLALVSSNFLQEKKDHNVSLRERDMVWMHGKMYRRAFLEKYNIRFNETRANEDVGFNTQCQCYANEHEQIYLAQDVTYLWQWRDNSTVRTDNQSYAYNESVEGYVQNKIYAFKSVLEQQDIDDPVRYFIMRGFAHLFKKYLLAMLQAPKQLRHIKKWARVYYTTLYPLIDEEYIKKAEPTILAQSGFTQPEHMDELQKFKELITKPKRSK